MPFFIISWKGKPPKDMDNYENLGIYRTLLHMRHQGDNFV
jgi:hypothetical protein